MTGVVTTGIYAIISDNTIAQCLIFGDP